MQLVRDVQNLGVSLVRQIEHADADLSAMWQGDAIGWIPVADLHPDPWDDATSPDAVANAVAANTWVPRWQCSPDFAAPRYGDDPIGWTWVESTRACGAGAAEDCSSPHSPGTCRPECEAPGVYRDSLTGVAALAGAAGLSVVPTLFKRSDRSVSVDPDPDATAADYAELFDAAGNASSAFSLDYMLDDGTGTPRTANLWLGTVDEWADAASGLAPDPRVFLHQYRLHQDFLVQLLDGGDWGAGLDLPFVNLGNELYSGAVTAADLGWYVLRTCEVVADCAPTAQKIYPAPNSLSNEPTGDAAYDTACETLLASEELAVPAAERQNHVRRIKCHLDETFFHVVRAALVAQVTDPDPSRFTGVLGPNVDSGWLKFQIAYNLFTHELLSYLSTVLGPDIADWQAALLPVPSNPRDLSWSKAYHRWFVRLVSHLNLRAPFEVMDFHWYNANGPRWESEQFNFGGFLYLSAARHHVDAIRGRLADWWTNGDDLPIWCSETGISSGLEPCHFIERSVVDVANGVRCIVHHSSSLWPMADNFGVPIPKLEQFEFRVAPDIVIGSLYPATVSFPPDVMEGVGLDLVSSCPDAPAVGSQPWPRWVFTDQHEQAVQVWTRLSYLAGCGTERVFWYTNQGNSIKGTTEGGVEGFYTYGVTEDGVFSRVRELTPGEFQCTSVADDTLYARRPKRPAWCALRRWNQFLDRYSCARLLLSGEDPQRGAYAVVFRRDPTSTGTGAAAHSAADYPYALVAWADPSAYSDSDMTAALTAAVGAGPAAPSFRIGFRRDAAAVASPLRVQTVPTVAVEGTGPYEVACADDAASPPPAGADGSHYQGHYWVFGPDSLLAEDGAGVSVIDVFAEARHLDPDAREMPILLLLPPGELFHGDAAGGTLLCTLDPV
ncbi:MAG: hypothetical protein HUU16_05140 [Candidatus Omnitrophica bacterium]|nr:hypothetical protein [Myxococcota bacterium]NUN95537.1 hypothetical protein [Candidatus Omnitrophota bacterium]